MRHFAITGIVTVSWISLIIPGSDMRATPPSRRMSAGTRSRAMTATAPASSATFACTASTTSMITPPFSISARPLLTLIVPISCIGLILAVGVRLSVAGFLGFLGFLGFDRTHVRLGRGEEDELAVLEFDAHRRPDLVADQQGVGVDNGGLLVVFPVLGARGEHPVADLVGKFAHDAKYAPAGMGVTLDACQIRSI